jgi:hypothetical protein
MLKLSWMHDVNDYHGNDHIRIYIHAQPTPMTTPTYPQKIRTTTVPTIPALNAHVQILGQLIQQPIILLATHNKTNVAKLTQ